VHENSSCSLWCLCVWQNQKQNIFVLKYHQKKEKQHWYDNHVFFCVNFIVDCLWYVLHFSMSHKAWGSVALQNGTLALYLKVTKIKVTVLYFTKQLFFFSFFVEIGKRSYFNTPTYGNKCFLSEKFHEIKKNRIKVLMKAPKFCKCWTHERRQYPIHIRLCNMLRS
jgi:hypothetical protein